MFPDNIKTIHVELTDKCQASCPMCPRNMSGGIEGDNVINVDISLEQFKTWFPVEFIKQLEGIRFCGNLGDPLMAKECTEVFQYVKESNPNCHIWISTNGSLRNTEWWKDLASTLSSNDSVTFAIDGLADTHHIYRRGTSWDKIIENAQSFINNGGIAIADVLVFKHNEHQIDELVNLLTSMNFSNINVKATDRFHGLNSFPVLNKLGEHEYDLLPAGDKWSQKFQPKFIELLEPVTFKRILEDTIVEPKCLRGENIYINAQGFLFPCCWINGSLDKQVNAWNKTMGKQLVQNKFTESASDIMNTIGTIKLSDTDIISELKNSKWNSLNTNNQLVCASNCGKNFIELISKL